MRTAFRLPMLLLSVVFLAGWAAPARAAEMTLSDCIRAALAANPGLKAVRLEVDRNDALRRSVRGRFLPQLKLSATLLHWDGEQVAALDLGSSMAPLEGVFTAQVADMSAAGIDVSRTVAALADMEQAFAAGGSGILIHEQLTISTKLTVTQPLTPLYGIWAGYRAQAALTDAARAEGDGRERALAIQVVNAYYGLVQARAMRQTAEAGLRQVEAYIGQVSALLAAGVVERNALMKVELQRARIRQMLFQAEKGVSLAAGGLNTLMARPLDEPVEPVLGELHDDPAGDRPLAELAGMALERRPELAAFRHRLDAARAGRHAAIGQMIPSLAAFFTYDHEYGFGSMQPEDTWFVGVAVDWPFWEWGASWYGYRASTHQADQAAAGLAAVENGVRLEVQSRRLSVEEARKSLGVAEQALAQAVENLRVEQARYEAQETTTAQLLEAQTLELQAKNELTVAGTRLRIALAELEVAIGGRVTGMDMADGREEGR